MSRIYQTSSLSMSINELGGSVVRTYAVNFLGQKVRKSRKKLQNLRQIKQKKTILKQF